MLYEVIDGTSRRVAAKELDQSSQLGNASLTVTCVNWLPYSLIDNCNDNNSNDNNSNDNSNVPNILAYGTSAGSLHLLDWGKMTVSSNSITETYSDTVIYSPAASGKRPCTGLSWNVKNSNLLAGGFEKSRSSSEFCCAVWDVEYKKQQTGSLSSALSFKPAAEEPTASICWLPYDPHILAVGTSIGLVRLYDIRVSNGGESLSLMAHPATRPRKVKGMRPDPFNPYVLTTFSDAAGEPVKLWDLRKGTSSKPKIIVMPHGPDSEGQYSAQSAVVDVAWSNARSGVIAVATTHQRQISFYSTVKPPPEVSTRLPIYSLPVADQIKSLSWQSSARHEEFSVDLAKGLEATDEAYFEKKIGGMYPSQSVNRLLVATSAGFLDFEVVEGAALSIGSSGHVAVSSSHIVEISQNSCLLNNELDDQYYDIEQVMKSRVASGYSVDPGKNLQTLSDELDYSRNNGKKVNSTLLELYRVWGWVDRVESLDNIDLNLENCGILTLLTNDINIKPIVTYNENLGTTLYSSEGRSLARIVCGWSREASLSSSHKTSEETDSDEDTGGNDESEEEDEFSDIGTVFNIVDECESLDSFERAAALAIWHGDIELAVKVLQRNIMKPTQSKIEAVGGNDNVSIGVGSVAGTSYDDDGVKLDSDKPGADAPLQFEERVVGRQDQSNAEYSNLVSLFTMCIAGYSPSKSNQSRSMWSSQCRRVLSQLESFEHTSTCYLIATCKFLLATWSNDNDDNETTDDRYLTIVEDSRLALEDRIAFACTYMDNDSAMKWLLRLQNDCKVSGCLEGLILTGMIGDGLGIMQNYLDIYADIQTVTLLACRTISAKPDLTNVSREWAWLHEYRSLLNQWQLFIYRAALDVELGRRNRQQDIINSSNKVGSAISHSTTADKKKDNTSSRVLYKLPLHSDSPHVFLRCHFCSSSLPLDVMPKQQIPYLRKQKPIINCCPACKKPLPRCYVCQLYMGLVNPYAEFNRALTQKRKVAEPSSSAANIASNEGLNGADIVKDEHNVLEFGRWFFFCQHCKHGGHAGCIDEWFGGSQKQSRLICGVNGCSCRCGR